MHLNLKDSDLKKYVYRTISYERLIELFESKENTLVKPKLWEDTFENFILRAKLKTENNETIEYDVHDRIYGQCWTLEKSSDAMWRIYSPDKKSIRIRTTVEKLLDSMTMSLIDTPKCFNCIGKVEYLSDRKLLDRAQQTFEKDGQVRFGKLFKSLLMKRKAFKHENEIRLLFLDWSEKAGLDELFKYKIDPHTLISQMMIDPRISYAEFKEIEPDIRDKTGYKGDIIRSLLYRLPENLTINISETKT